MFPYVLSYIWIQLRVPIVFCTKAGVWLSHRQSTDNQEGRMRDSLKMLHATKGGKFELVRDKEDTKKCVVQRN